LFRSFEHQVFHLTALGAVALTYIPGARVFPRLSAASHDVERILLRALPG